MGEREGQAPHPAGYAEDGRAAAAGALGAPGAQALQQAVSDELLGRDGHVPPRELHDEVQPKASEAIVSSPKMREAHPLQHDSTVQGLLQVFHELSGMLCEISGMRKFALSTAAGAQGELAGVLMIRKYLSERGR